MLQQPTKIFAILGGQQIPTSGATQLGNNTSTRKYWQCIR
jgi:hypothetical protein